VLFKGEGINKRSGNKTTKRMTPYIGTEEDKHMQERKNVLRNIRVNNVERLAGKPHESFIEGLASKEVGLLYQMDYVMRELFGSSD
jgi:hypothetical protein